jgi:glycosyltransferase involved in cell wall biosynthesis
MKLKIGLFRALDVRFSQVDLAASFKQFEARFITHSPSAIQDYLKQQRVPYENIPLVPRYGIDPVSLFLRVQDYSSWLEFDRFRLERVSTDLDVFEVYEPYFFYSAQIARLAKKKQIPLVTETWVSFAGHPSRLLPIYRQNVSEVMKQTDLFLLRCKKASSYLLPYNVPLSKQLLVYPGVNLVHFYPSQRKISEKVRILFVGALGRHKGIDDILAVFPRLVEKYGKKVELLICGQGVFQQAVHQAAKTLPIRYLGQVPYPDLPEIYRQADIFCGPSKDYYFAGWKSWEEFLGYTFMEAQASGLPVVTTHCGGIPEIVQPENILISQGNREELYQALETFISNPQLRKDVGGENRKRAEKLFDINKQTALTEDAIKERFFS